MNILFDKVHTVLFPVFFPKINIIKEPIIAGGKEIPERVYPDLQFRARLSAGGETRHHRQTGPPGAGDLPGQSRL